MAHHNTVFAQMLKLIPTCLSRQADREVKQTIFFAESPLFR